MLSSAETENENLWISSGRIFWRGLRKTNSDLGAGVNLNWYDALNDEVKEIKEINKVRSTNIERIIEMMREEYKAIEEKCNVEVTTVKTLEKLL